MLEFLIAVAFIAVVAVGLFAVLTAGEDPRLDPWGLTWQEVVWLANRMVLLHDAGKGYLRRFALYRWFEAWCERWGWYGMVAVFAGKAVLLGYLPLLLLAVLGQCPSFWLWVSPAAYAVAELFLIFAVRQIPVLWRRRREWRLLLGFALACLASVLAVCGLFTLTLNVSLYAAGPIRP